MTLSHKRHLDRFSRFVMLNSPADTDTHDTQSIHRSLHIRRIYVGNDRVYALHANDAGQ